MKKNIWIYTIINIILLFCQLIVFLSLYLTNQNFKLISDIFFAMAIFFVIVILMRHLWYRRQKTKLILKTEQLTMAEKEISNYYIKIKNFNDHITAYIYYLKNYHLSTTLTFLINIIFGFIIAIIFGLIK